VQFFTRILQSKIYNPGRTREEQKPGFLTNNLSFQARASDKKPGFWDFVRPQII